MLQPSPSIPRDRKHRAGPWWKASGFTIVEVMAAAAVMALAISTSVTTLQVGYRAIDTARNTTIASQVLQSMIEDIRLLTWSQVSNPSLLPNLTNRPLADFDLDTTNRYQSRSITEFSANAAAMLSRFTFSRAMTDVSGRVDGAGICNMKMVVLTARWTGVDGMSHTVYYYTYYAKDGLYAFYST